MLRNLFVRRTLWSIRVFRGQSASQLLNLSLDQCELIHVVDQPRLRASARHAVTLADPFLFSRNGRLYLFYELQTDFGPGEIHAQSMDASGVWLNHGCVLREPFHLSFPNVFSVGSDVYMLPEMSAAGRVVLYKAEQFPERWVPATVLLEAPLLDPLLLARDGAYLLLGSSPDYRLLAYTGESLLQAFHAAPEHLVSDDMARSRNGGAPIRLGDRWFRPFQNCRERYGAELGLTVIEQMDAKGYRERECIANLLTVPQAWMADGYHGLSTADFEGAFYFALDGRRKDALINNYLLGWHKLKAKVWQLAANGRFSRSMHENPSR